MRWIRVQNVREITCRLRVLKSELLWKFVIFFYGELKKILALKTNAETKCESSVCVALTRLLLQGPLRRHRCCITSTPRRRNLPPHPLFFLNRGGTRRVIPPLLRRRHGEDQSRQRPRSLQESCCCRCAPEVSGFYFRQRRLLQQPGHHPSQEQVRGGEPGVPPAHPHLAEGHRGLLRGSWQEAREGEPAASGGG